MRTLLSFLLLGALACSAQVPAVQRTRAALNGRYWTSIDDSYKVFFLVGYFDAQLSWSPPTSTVNDSIPSTAIGDIVSGLDRFYGEPENLRFPISAALKIFAMKVDGKSQSDIDKTMDLIRRMLADSHGQFRMYDVMGTAPNRKE